MNLLKQVHNDMENCTVIIPHTASYEDPIIALKGATLHLTGGTDRWNGYLWIWAVASDGREGWVPDDLIVEISGRTVASRDYSAVELSCELNESLQVLERTHGWAWCKNLCDEFGWVPLQNF